jgi:DNA-binding beta-propeller fold protein YncE
MRKTMMRCAWLGLMVIVLVGLCVRPGAAQRPAKSAGMPVFQVDPTWPALPNNWVVGIVSAVTVDKRDHVWILHRPRSVAAELKGRAAPPVLEFDADGKFVTAWGGDGTGYDWPTTEHGITIDSKDVVWIGGSGVGDDMLLNFSLQGKFLREFGKARTSTGNADTGNVNRPADIFVDAKTNEAYVADGYGNRRLVIFDASTGKFKRMWGAFGNPPDSDPPAGAGPAADGGRGGGGRGRGAQAAPVLDTEGNGAEHFGNPVHAVKMSNDNLVYVADRSNRRIQVFTPAGKYVTQVFINRAGPSAGSVAGLAFSPDPQQQFLYAADYGNSHIAVLDRKTLDVLYQFGTRSAKPGEFQGPHHIAVDSKGNLYVAEVAPGNRAQKFLLKGMSPTPPPNALTAAQLASAP